MTGGKTWSWNGTTWNIFATANLVSSGNIVPSQNSTFDLGTSSQRWRDLYLSGNTLIIGNATISASGSGIVLPSGTKVSGNFATAQSINSQAANYTLVLDDAGKLIRITGTGANLTIPTNSSVAFPIGSQLDLVNDTTGSVSVVGAAGVELKAAANIFALTERYSTSSLVKIDTDTWLMKTFSMVVGTTTTTTTTTTAAPSSTGQTAYTTAGTYSWVCPAGVTSVCVVAVGGGGDGASSGSSGSGGGLGWKNNISVTPGQSYTVVVGGSSGDSYFINTSTVKGGGGGGNGGAAGTYTGDGGGNGGTGAAGSGGAGGYTGAGGAGVSGYEGTAGNGSGGGGGGGEFYRHIQNGWYEAGAGGGGVGLLGQGSNGAGATSSSVGGGGGSGGTGGSNCEAADQGGAGGAYGGGGGKGGWLCNRDYSTCGRSDAGGAVRIIWGAGRSFPSTNTGNL